MPGNIPIEAQRELLKAKIVPGSILHIHCDFIYNPHEKFVVVADIDFDYSLLLVFLINTRIYPLKQKDTALKACHVKLHCGVTDYSFLDHDSYVDCTEVFDNFDPDFVLDYILAHPNDHKCFVRGIEIKSIIQAVLKAPTITDYDKESIVESLSKI